ncbi:hypothetical protein [Halorubrum sp. AJ67]|uniref:hypothetical protein n=1 Tax=Halorubrum sp. AJ67 TaxID=1173487 RepID=UPI00064EA5C9|nr:hypothetical protein [Halorubrum sp. AJ67]
MGKLTRVLGWNVDASASTVVSGVVVAPEIVDVDVDAVSVTSSASPTTVTSPCGTVGADIASNSVTDGAAVDATPGVSVIELALVGADSAVFPESADGWVVDTLEPACDGTGAAIASDIGSVVSDVAPWRIALAVSVISRLTVNGDALAVVDVVLHETAVVRDDTVGNTEAESVDEVGADIATPDTAVGVDVALSSVDVGVSPTLALGRFVLEPALMLPALDPTVAPTVGDVGVVVGDIPVPAGDDVDTVVGDDTLPTVPTTVAGEVDVATVSG